ncbi:CZB domain-containing protein [Hymenobacter sp. J193]|uniref:CZB domain-containing protein n=1 Tax=Hymenobacter sp. J193 TaxID=2898429 RepID=UPI0021509488|nr:CZB domain-containing protein [Hymenobacter sp. J193]MCR5888941.1 CZB domain-containing protein [Hymenobacter sp. J193]
MLDELKQEFEGALIKHMVFKSKLRSFLHGSGTQEGPIRDPEVCSFGQWIREKALPAYGRLPETQELDRLHRLIHQQANQLMDQHLRGQREEALAGFPAVQRLADHITLLLQTMEQKLRNGA